MATTSGQSGRQHHLGEPDGGVKHLPGVSFRRRVPAPPAATAGSRSRRPRRAIRRPRRNAVLSTIHRSSRILRRYRSDPRPLPGALTVVITWPGCSGGRSVSEPAFARAGQHAFLFGANPVPRAVVRRPSRYWSLGSDRRRLRTRSTRITNVVFSSAIRRCSVFGCRWNCSATTLSVAAPVGAGGTMVRTGYVPRPAA